MELDNLPHVVWNKLAEYLDFESRQACRAVSRRFKTEIDYVGHSITVGENYDHQRSLSKITTLRVSDILIQYFLSKTKVNEIKIHELYREVLFLSNHLTRLKSAIILGHIDPRWFANLLGRNCNLLTKLFLGGKFLYAQDLDLTTTTNTNNNHDNVPCFTFLKELHIILNEPKMYFYILFNDLRHSEIEHLVEKNMNYLLRKIRSPQLTLLYCRVSTPSLISRVPTNWVYNPLYDFIGHHSKTLKQIYLPVLIHSSMPYDNSEDRITFRSNVRNLCMPKELKSLQIEIRSPSRFPLYWKRMILCQVFLEELSWENIEIAVLSVQRLKNLLSNIICNNFKTLKYIRLHFIEYSNDTEHLNLVDCNLFQPCTQLKVLSLEKTGQRIETVYGMFIRNLTLLPYKLRELTISGIKISKDFDGLTFVDKFKDLEMLHLDAIGCKGMFKVHRLVIQFVNKILRHRSLNSFYLKFDAVLPKGWRKVVQDIWVDLKCQYVFGLDSFNLLIANQEQASMFNRYHLLNHRICLFAMRNDPKDYFTNSTQWDEIEEISHFMKLNSKHFYIDSSSRFQPFNLDLQNYKSFSVFKSRDTSKMKIIPNYMSTTKRVHALEYMKITTTFILPNTKDVAKGNDNYAPVKLLDSERTVNQFIFEKISRDKDVE